MFESCGWNRATSGGSKAVRQVAAAKHRGKQQQLKNGGRGQ
jgi:hypothetical protein